MQIISFNMDVYLKLQISCLKISGMWPIDHESPKIYKYYAYTIRCIFLIGHIFHHKKIISSYNYIPIEEFAPMVSINLLHVAFFLKIRSVWNTYNRGLVMEVRKTEAGIFKSGDQYLINLYKRSCKLTNALNCTLMIWAPLVGAAMVATVPIVSKCKLGTEYNCTESSFSYEIWLPLNRDNHFKIIWFVSSMFLSYMAAIIVTVDNYLIALLIYIYFQLKMVCYYFETIKSDELFTAVQYFGIILTEQFLYYWCANEVSFMSGEIHGAVWATDWYNFPYNHIRDLRMVLIRCKKPIYMHVGPFYTMTIGSFIGVLKATMSYATLLQATQEDGPE